MSKCTWHTHAIRAFLDTKLFDQPPGTQLSSNCTDILYKPILSHCEFWGFFLDVQGLGHFIEHLVYLRFSENSKQKRVEPLNVSCLVVLPSPLQTQWRKLLTFWCSEPTGTRRCRSWRTQDARARMSASCAFLCTWPPLFPRVPTAP